MNNEVGGTELAPSLGKRRVRVNFNVAERSDQRSTIDIIKGDTANLIDLCETVKQVALQNVDPNNKGEIARLWSLAQTAYEEAAMWAVKAITL